jgi:hypothetical protein
MASGEIDVGREERGKKRERLLQAWEFYVMCVYVDVYIHTYGKMKDASFFKIHAGSCTFHLCVRISLLQRRISSSEKFTKNDRTKNE